MPSFDIVSEVDEQEVRNAVENATRELSTRFDFRGVDAGFEWKPDQTTMHAEGDFQLGQMLDILRNKLVKRGVDPDSIDTNTPVHAGKNWTQVVTFKSGIEGAMAKKVVKHIKDSKLKVQVAIQGEEVRVTGKKRDDLQAVMALVRDGDLGQPFQFKNFRD